jgi:DNA-binding MarR family transcriptional regulator
MTQNRRLIYQLNVARHTMMKALDAASRQQLGISAVQLSALMVLHENNGCLMKELANTLMLDKSAVTGLVSRMQQSGLLLKAVCDKDSRSSRLTITGHGRACLHNGLGLLKGVNRQISNGFTEQELDTVSRFLNHITATFSKES